MAARDGQSLRACAGPKPGGKIRDDGGSFLHGVTGPVQSMAKPVPRCSRASSSRNILPGWNRVAPVQSAPTVEDGCPFEDPAVSKTAARNTFHLNLWAALFRGLRFLYSTDHLHGAKKPGRLQRRVRLIELRRSEGISLDGVWLAIANDAIRPAIRYLYFDGIGAGA